MRTSGIRTEGHRSPYLITPFSLFIFPISLVVLDSPMGESRVAVDAGGCLLGGVVNGELPKTTVVSACYLAPMVACNICLA